MLQGQRRNQALDLGRFGHFLSLLFEIAANNILPDIILLRQVEELTDLISALRAKTARVHTVGQARDFAVACSSNDILYCGEY